MLISFYWRHTVSFLKCASCRFATLYFVPFFAGLAFARRDTLGYAGLGALFWIIHTMAIEVTNRLSDRREDELNRPERTALCASVGWTTLETLELGLWCAVLLIDVAWLILAGNLEFAVLLALGVGVGISYSRGLRLARTRYIGLLVLNLVFSGTFIMGWSVGNPFSQPTHIWLKQMASFTPILVIVGVFIVTLIGVKDLTDRAGDLRVGYHSPFVDLVERRHAIFIWCLIGCPFVLIIACLLLGLVPARMLALVGFVPVSAILAEAVRHARTPAESLIVREVFYSYWLAFCSSGLLLFLPGKALALAIAGAISYWILTTQWLHWGERIHLIDLIQIIRISGVRGKVSASAR
jgi:4-hydroxybenzoate polyprenyltransferase